MVARLVRLPLLLLLLLCANDEQLVESSIPLVAE